MISDKLMIVFDEVEGVPDSVWNAAYNLANIEIENSQGVNLFQIDVKDALNVLNSTGSACNSGQSGGDQSDGNSSPSGITAPSVGISGNGGSQAAPGTAVYASGWITFNGNTTITWTNPGSSTSYPDTVEVNSKVSMITSVIDISDEEAAQALSEVDDDVDRAKLVLVSCGYKYK